VNQEVLMVLYHHLLRQEKSQKKDQESTGISIALVLFYGAVFKSAVFLTSPRASKTMRQTAQREQNFASLDLSRPQRRAQKSHRTGDSSECVHVKHTQKTSKTPSTESALCFLGFVRH
jgi:hypothetical protein